MAVTRLRRIVDAFIGQLEGAEMVADAEGCTAQAEAFDRLFRVLMLRLHEPARLIGADRHDGDADVTVFRPDFAVVLALGIAGVTDMVDLAARGFDDKAAQSAMRRSPMPRADQ